MKTEKILNLCQRHNFAVSDLKALSIHEAESIFSVEHFQNLKRVARADPDIELAAGTIEIDSINRLILLELDETRAITQSGRSLQEVGGFIKSHHITTPDLVSRWLDREWAQRVLDYYNNFDTLKLGYFILIPPLDDELAQTKNGVWYIADGNHRALALILKMIDGYEPAGLEVVLAHYDRARLRELKVYL